MSTFLFFLALFVTLYKPDGALNGPVNHENVQDELEVCESFQDWHYLPIKTNDGDFVDPILPVGQYLDSPIDHFLFLLVAQCVSNNLIGSGNHNADQADQDPLPYRLVTAFEVVPPILPEIHYGPQNYQEQKDITASRLWS